jgi:hypothetical protein
VTDQLLYKADAPAIRVCTAVAQTVAGRLTGR